MRGAAHARRSRAAPIGPRASASRLARGELARCPRSARSTSASSSAAGEGRALAGALHLDEPAARRSRPRSCRPRRASPPRRRGRGAARRRRARPRPPRAARGAAARGRAPPRDEAPERERERDVAARDRRGARAAVGLEHVAVDVERALAERAESATARRLRPIRRWISCVRPDGRPRVASRSAAPVGRAGQHASTPPSPSPAPSRAGSAARSPLRRRCRAPSCGRAAQSTDASGFSVKSSVELSGRSSSAARPSPRSLVASARRRRPRRPSRRRAGAAAPRVEAPRELDDRRASPSRCARARPPVRSRPPPGRS